MAKKIKCGCPYCGGAGGCFGQCDERWKAAVEQICAPLLKLQKDLAKILLLAKRPAAKSKRAGEGA